MSFLIETSTKTSTASNTTRIQALNPVKFQALKDGLAKNVEISSSSKHAFKFDASSLTRDFENINEVKHKHTDFLLDKLWRG